jgi:hypothetical protein
MILAWSAFWQRLLTWPIFLFNFANQAVGAQMPERFTGYWQAFRLSVSQYRIATLIQLFLLRVWKIGRIHWRFSILRLGVFRQPYWNKSAPDPDGDAPI